MQVGGSASHHPSHDDDIDDESSPHPTMTGTRTAGDQQSAAEEVKIKKFTATLEDVWDRTIIDYSTEEGMEVWIDSTKPVGMKGFDCTAANLRSFISDLKRHPFWGVWKHSVLSIPIDPTTNGRLNHGDTSTTTTTLDFVKYHYKFSMEHLRTVAAQYVGTPTRVAQDSIQLSYCLLSSLSDNRLHRVLRHEADYTINGKGVGILLLKVIIHMSIGHMIGYDLREKLRNIDRYLAMVDFDIPKTNMWVRSLLWWLLRFKGEEPEDLVWHLLRAYRTVRGDREFSQYIKYKQHAFWEGTLDLKPKKLMLLVENKFNQRMAEEDWCPTGS